MKNSYKEIHLFFVISLFFLISCQILKAENDNFQGNIQHGFSLYQVNCTACHSIDLNKKLIGPPLIGITTKRTRHWLHEWITNNKALRDRKDKDAVAIYDEYNHIEMNLFPQLSENDIDDILSFIKTPLISKKENIDRRDLNHPINYNNWTSEKLILLGFSILSVILLIILLRLYTLIRVLNIKKIHKNEIRKGIIAKQTILITISDLFKKYRILSYIMMGIFFLSSLFEIWNFLIQIDVNQGYQPDQPIYFSHKIHSGIYQINCQYCHSSAKYGKVAGIPSMNVCMNCHSSITEYTGDYIENGKNKSFYTSEIQKIYKIIGWNINTRTYSGKQKSIKWIRIHNMPDFVYFNHAQHIKIGKEGIKKTQNVDEVCNACHGEVQKMNTVNMANTFTMGWCIHCHRITEINKNNKYYEKYFHNRHHDIHKKRNKVYSYNMNSKVTVDAVGGIECAKCHY